MKRIIEPGSKVEVFQWKPRGANFFVTASSYIYQDGPSFNFDYEKQTGLENSLGYATWSPSIFKWVDGEI